LTEINSLKNITLHLFALIEDHLRKKERIFYPFVSVSKEWKSKENAKNNLIKNPIRQISDEQSVIRREWMKLRNITTEIESIACKSKHCLTCLTGLFDIEQELNKQFHLEQTILFPKLLENTLVKE
jgi:iron-sulfur cluster repair protein YtfE (RIC family)